MLTAQQGLRLPVAESLPLTPLGSTGFCIGDAFKPQKRQRLGAKLPIVHAVKPETPAIDDLGDLGDRILSGEFTDAGSTREKWSRPVRKFLAKDPIGPGMLLCG